MKSRTDARISSERPADMAKRITVTLTDEEYCQLVHLSAHYDECRIATLAANLIAGATEAELEGLAYEADLQRMLAQMSASGETKH